MLNFRRIYHTTFSIESWRAWWQTSQTESLMRSLGEVGKDRVASTNTHTYDQETRQNMRKSVIKS